MIDEALLAMIVDMNAAAESAVIRAEELLLLNNLAGARVWLERATKANGLAGLAWSAAGRTDLVRVRDMAAFARAQLGLPLNDEYPARGMPLDWKPKKPRKPAFRATSAEIIELPRPDLTPAGTPPVAPWNRPLPYLTRPA